MKVPMPRRGLEIGSVGMPFMVIYRTSDGSSNHEQLEAIDEAALFVERLRNNEGVDQIRIYRMEEISFAFRPYYKVELGMPERQQHPTPPIDVVGNGSATLARASEPAPETHERTTDEGEVAEVEVAEAVAEVVVEAPPAPDAPVEAAGAEGPAPAPPAPTPELGANGARRGLFGR